MNMSFRFNPFILETNMNQFKVFNGSFPSCPSPPFQSESWCKTFILEISFIHIQMLVHLHVNEINFHIKGFALELAFKQRQKAPATKLPKEQFHFDWVPFYPPLSTLSRANRFRYQKGESIMQSGLCSSNL